MSSTFPRWEDDATPRFVRDLAELARQSWNVTVLAPHHPGAALRDASPAEDERGALDVRRFRYFRPSSRQRLCYGGGILPNVRSSKLALAQVPCLLAAELAAMRRLLATSRFDLVHAHFLVPQGVVAAIATRGPLVVSIHGSDLFALRGRVFDAAIRRVLARATLVTVNGEVAAREVRRRFPRITDKLRTLPMGVDTRLFRRPSEEERRAPASAPLIAFVGRLSAQKGAHVLLEAFARLDARRRARLVIAGDGPELDRLRALAAEMGPPSAHVDFVGPLSAARVAALLREATLLVVPSLEGPLGLEAQGLVAIEAMVSGCPLVVSRSGGLGALAGDPAHEVGPRGIAVPPSDPAALAGAIARCLDDEDGTRARANAAHAFAIARYEWARIGQALLAIYDEARGC